MYPGRRRGRKRKAEKLAEIAMAEALARRQTARAIASYEPGRTVTLPSSQLSKFLEIVPCRKGKQAKTFNLSTYMHRNRSN